MKRIVEIRAAEGGEDSKLFVRDLAAAYAKHFTRVGWRHRLIDVRDGELSIEVEGPELSELNQESGGHRIQRVPPTERKGRVHSSTVTVAVIDPKEAKEITFNDRDFKIEWYSGTGCGGQNRNKIQACCRLTYLPTGQVVTAQHRSRENSLTEARTELLTRLNNGAQRTQQRENAADRKNQVGSGMRGDKKRTYRFRDNLVKDHETGKICSCDRAMNGHFDDLWE